MSCVGHPWQAAAVPILGPWDQDLLESKLNICVTCAIYGYRRHVMGFRSNFGELKDGASRWWQLRCCNSCCNDPVISMRFPRKRSLWSQVATRLSATSTKHRQAKKLTPCGNGVLSAPKHWRAAMY
jgi:hypothetical protein